MWSTVLIHAVKVYCRWDWGDQILCLSPLVSRLRRLSKYDQPYGCLEDHIGRSSSRERNSMHAYAMERARHLS